tara:strand:- start:12830 stop:13018 length:189 start_codon:yes stop_codon:yes gene_type:complete
MRIHFWHSKDMNEWRWSIYTKRFAPDGTDHHQSTGSSKEIRDAFNKVADTVEKLAEGKCPSG